MSRRKGHPNLFRNSEDEVAIVVHGDGMMILADVEGLGLDYKKASASKYRMKTVGSLGLGLSERKQWTVSRSWAWTKEGILHEPDPRHAYYREDTGIRTGEFGNHCGDQEGRHRRGQITDCKSKAPVSGQDRADIQYATI